MDDLGHCPLCGGIVKHMCDDEGIDYIDCYSDGCPYVVSDNADTYHNRLSAMGELWRLLEWAGQKKLFIVPSDGTCDAFVWKEVPSRDNRPQLAIVSWDENTLDALREATRKMEENNE